MHKDFLDIIKDAPYSVMVCNYIDSEGLYDRYLTEDKWTRRIYPTLTAVGGKPKSRQEAVWVNY